MTDLIAIKRELARLHDQVAYIERALPTIKTSLQLIEQHLFAEPQPAPSGSKFNDIVHPTGVRSFADRMKTGDVPMKMDVVDQNIEDLSTGLGYNGEKASREDRQFLRDAKAKAVSLEVVKTRETVAAAAPIEPLTITDEWAKIDNELLNGTEHMFVTGRAGCGKSTMLEQFVSKYPGNLAVLSPTGVAALRVGGMTIHRFFHFAAHALDDNDIHYVSEPAKRMIYTRLDALLIDEASMVRADLMDAIDKFLRKNKDKTKQFGGVRIILFGDPFQLPPIAKERDEKKWLKHKYGTELSFFFHAECWRDEQPKIYELTTVFRQKDKVFSDALTAVRDGTLTDEQMALINSRVQPSFQPSVDGDPWLTLTTTNDSADRANQAVLRALPGDPKAFTASIIGDFKDCPTDEVLQLKVGAPVMMIRNDNVHRYWVNGTLGKITNLNPLRVKTASGEHPVEQETWQKIAYVWNDKAKKLTKNVEAEFIQIPMRHASAITIHKSQSASYDRCILDLGSGTFASGQAYVGLSRCRTLEGMVLRRALRKEDVMVNDEVLAFMAGRPIAKPEPAQPTLDVATTKD